MSSHGLLAFLCASILATFGLSASDGQAAKSLSSANPSVGLCSLLRSIGAGDRLNVSVEGIFLIGPEHQIFYGLDSTSCGPDTQPSTWVQFGSRYTSSPELDELMDKDGRALVAVKGVLWGPQRPPPDNPTIPPALAYIQRTGPPGRYGHHYKFRTQLEIEEVVTVQKVPSWAPGPPRSFSLSRSAFPVVTQAQAPTSYPSKASTLGIEGDVVVEIDLKMGNAVSTKVISAADRLLIEDTIANITTWIFDPEAEATFTTTFSYRFEDDLPPTTAAVRVRTELPVKVEIVAPRNNW